MPTTHFSTLDKDAAILLFIITSTKSMDVGVIIIQRIRRSTNNHRFSYFFPQLATAFCAKVRAKFLKGEVLLQAGELLNPN